MTAMIFVALFLAWVNWAETMRVKSSRASSDSLAKILSDAPCEMDVNKYYYLHKDDGVMWKLGWSHGLGFRLGSFYVVAVPFFIAYRVLGGLTARRTSAPG